MTPRFAVSLDEGITAGRQLLAPVHAAHRARLLDLLGSLGDTEWRAPTRCGAWSAHEVARHVRDGAEFLTAVLERRPTPFDLGAGFDPNETPTQLLERTAGESPSATVAALRDLAAAEATALGPRVDAWENDQAIGPIGPTHWSGITAHVLWDNWLHERDVSVPLGRDARPSPDETVLFAAYSLYVATMPALLTGKDIDVTVLLDTGHGPLTLHLTPGAVVATDEAGDAPLRGEAVAVAEAVTGRGARVEDVLDGPADVRKPLTWLAAYFRRG